MEAKLTKTENEIANLVRKGLNNDGIGDRLHISPKTVKFHLTNIYGKLELNKPYLNKRVSLALKYDSSPST